MGIPELQKRFDDAGKAERLSSPQIIQSGHPGIIQTSSTPQRSYPELLWQGAGVWKVDPSDGSAEKVLSLTAVKTTKLVFDGTYLYVGQRGQPAATPEYPTSGVVKFQYADGAFSFVRGYPYSSWTPGSLEMRDWCVDASGNLYMAGGASYWGGSEYTVRAVAADGSELWRYNTASANDVYAVENDAAGNVFISGAWVDAAGTGNSHVIKLDSSGAWQAEYDHGNRITSLLVDGTALYVGGAYGNGTDGGGQVRKLTTNLSHTWSYDPGGDVSPSYVYEMALCSDGSLICGGSPSRLDGYHLIRKLNSSGSSVAATALGGGDTLTKGQIAVSGSSVFVGGRRSVTTGGVLFNLTALDSSLSIDWQACIETVTYMGEVEGLAVYDGYLYVAVT